MSRCRTRGVHHTAVGLLGAALLSGCAGFIPTIGPSRHAIERGPLDPGIHPGDGRRRRGDPPLAATAHAASVLPDARRRAGNTATAGPGDVLEVSLWEAAPATLFGATVPEPGAPSPLARDHASGQPVDSDGYHTVPFAGRIPAAGKTLHAIEAEIVRRLTGKANQPEVMVRLTHNFSSNATVVGEVNVSTRVPLAPGNQRLLDALAAAQGVRQPVNKMTIQVTRDNSVYALPLETIIRDPRQNVPLQAGDVVTALFQPYSFTALGASGKNEEINFETQGIALAQALARLAACWIRAPIRAASSYSASSHATRSTAAPTGDDDAGRHGACGIPLRPEQPAQLFPDAELSDGEQGHSLRIQCADHRDAEIPKRSVHRRLPDADRQTGGVLNRP